jgi:DNA-directed RNA polymerase specialized sigma24 family protein
MAFEVFPWNEWIRLLIGGDEALFLNGLRRAVYGSRFLRGKSAEALRRDYGADDVRDEIVQEVALRTLHLWDASGNRSNEEIARYVAATITHALNDRYRRAQRERVLFLSSDAPPGESESAHRDTPDLKPTPEAEWIGKQFVEALQRELTPLQSSILRGHERFGLGPHSSRDLAIIRGVSVKAIEKQVGVVRRKVIKFALNNGYLSPGGNQVGDNRVAKTATETHEGGAGG